MHLLLALPAPAKLNLFLHVTGRRADGYHELQTAYTLIDLADWLDFERRDDGSIVREGDLVGAVEDDLVVRAARDPAAGFRNVPRGNDQRNEADSGGQRSRRRLIRRGDHADCAQSALGLEPSAQRVERDRASTRRRRALFPARPRCVRRRHRRAPDDDRIAAAMVCDPLAAECTFRPEKSSKTQV